jgi:hypothetical protein
MRWSAAAVFAVVLLGLVLGCPHGIAVAAAPAAAHLVPAAASERYTMTAFTNSSETAMFVYESADAMNYRLVRGPAYTPPTGLVRDPSMFRHGDGAYYVVYTTGWDGDTIGFARSPDRVHWTFLRDYTIPLRGVRHTWAPVWFVDGGQVDVIVSLSFGGDFQPYLMTAADPSLASWTMPAPLAGIGMNHIDTVMIKTGAVYHAFVKNETTKFVEHAIAPSPVGPFLFVGTGDWAHWGAPREGPSLARLADGCWRIYLDGYTVGAYFYSDSCDGFLTWSPARTLPGVSGFVRHFTVLREPAG